MAVECEWVVILRRRANRFLSDKQKSEDAFRMMTRRFAYLMDVLCVGCCDFHRMWCGGVVSGPLSLLELGNRRLPLVGAQEKATPNA